VIVGASVLSHPGPHRSSSLPAYTNLAYSNGTSSSRFAGICCQRPERRENTALCMCSLFARPRLHIEFKPGRHPYIFPSCCCQFSCTLKSLHHTPRCAATFPTPVQRQYQRTRRIRAILPKLAYRTEKRISEQTRKCLQLSSWPIWPSDRTLSSE